MARPLAVELLTDFVVALVVAIVLSRTTACGYAGRVGLTTLLGLLVAFRPIQQWTWYEFPAAYTAARVLDGLIGFLVLGLVAGAIVRPRAL